ncbi:MAG TPA: thiamine phosphate synthase [Acidobacteriota bacterium]|nr:thiamine phosphate synthase [Acidobacteriota bacterium]
MAKLELPPIYPITASSALTGTDHVAQARAFLSAGLCFFQVREKQMDDRTFCALLLQIRQLCDQASAQFIINDRIDLALASGADGVHLGQTDLPVDIARRLLGKDAIIGISTHNRNQFLQAQEMDVDYVAVGPIYRTGTKESPYPPLNHQFIQEVVELKRHPLVAIGGISLETAPRVWEAGADSVALISDIVAAPNPGQRISEYLRLSRR